MTAGLERALGSRRALAIVIALVMGMAATSISIGFLTDDHSFRAALSSTSSRAPAAYDLFRFVPGDAEGNQLRIRVGHLPWWAAPDLKIHFLRPLTSLAFVADTHAFGAAPLGYHLQSLAWYLLLLVAAAIVFRQWLPPAAATLAVAVFGLAAAHVEAYAWISARHVVIAGAFAAAALAARGARRRWLAFGLLVVGLASSEATLAVVPLWVACELAAAARSWRARMLACVPAGGLAAVYLVAYAALGCGTRGSDGYHDPLTNPLGFVALAAVRVPLLLGDAALGIPAELAHVVAEPRLALLGLAAISIVAIAWWLTARRGAAERVSAPPSGTTGVAAGGAARTASSQVARTASSAGGGISSVPAAGVATRRSVAHTSDVALAPSGPAAADEAGSRSEASAGNSIPSFGASLVRASGTASDAVSTQSFESAPSANARRVGDAASDANAPRVSDAASDANTRRVSDAAPGSNASRVSDAASAASTAASMQGRAVGWLVLGGVAATVLGAAGYPAGRVLVIPDLAFAAVLGLLLHRGLTARWPGLLAAAVLAIVHLGLAPLASLHTIAKLERRARATEAISSQIIALAPPSGRVLVIAASDPMVFLYPRGIVSDTAPGVVRCWSVLSAARAGHRVTRTGPRTLTLEPIERPLLDGSFDRLFRSDDRPFAVGDHVEQCGATIRVAALRDGHPSRVEVELRRSFDDPEIGLLVWRNHALERFVPPAVGETAELPWSPGPSGAL